MTDIIKREYVIPLRRGFLNTPRYYRTQKAMRVLKVFIAKHMKSDNMKIGPKLNELVWEKGIKNPPAKVKVIAIKDKEGLVKVELVGVDYVDFKQVETKEKAETLKEKIVDKVTTAKETKKEIKEEKEAKAEETEEKEEKKKASQAAIPKLKTAKPKIESKEKVN
jgi:large subunit ribosomal protein L31e